MLGGEIMSWSRLTPRSALHIILLSSSVTAATFGSDWSNIIPLRQIRKHRGMLLYAQEVLLGAFADKKIVPYTRRSVMHYSRFFEVVLV